ncbi:hypothetical protein O181_043191 [Austropuccinia psidii MF-1]|uniref:Uncharacterized protein n=1 Tax=Austropuccinia psidii MF-1 TaxID=1389203 RepID=A0A9Q3DG69_9BASI|nr:hypothetical protein [Austropuccinia psidii MF-1]
MLVMLARKHTRNSCLLCNPSAHRARRVPAQDGLVRMKEFPSRNGHQDPKKEDRNDSRKLSWFNVVSICPPPPRPPSDGHSTSQPEKSDYLADEGW